MKIIVLVSRIKVKIQLKPRIIAHNNGFAIYKLIKIHTGLIIQQTIPTNLESCIKNFNPVILSAFNKVNIILYNSTQRSHDITVIS